MERINKIKARTLYNNGYTIYIAPCNYKKPVDAITKASNGNFDKVSNAYRISHCNRKSGYYPAYYV